MRDEILSVWTKLEKDSNLAQGMSSKVPDRYQNPKQYIYCIDSDEIKFEYVWDEYSECNRFYSDRIELIFNGHNKYVHYPKSYLDEENEIGFHRLIIVSDYEWEMKLPLIYIGMEETELANYYLRDKTSKILTQKNIYKNLHKFEFSRRNQDEIISIALELSKEDSDYMTCLGKAIKKVEKRIENEKNSQIKELSPEIEAKIGLLVEQNGDKITLKTIDKMVNFLTGQILKEHKGIAPEIIKQKFIEYFRK